MSYSTTELLALDSEFKLISQKLTAHFSSCGDCFLSHAVNRIPCPLTEPLFVELESIAEVLNRDIENFFSTEFYYFTLGVEQNDEKAIRDYQYELGVAEYVVTSREQPSERWPSHPSEEHWADVQDAWLSSQEGQRAVKANDIPTDQLDIATNMAHAASLGYFTEEPDPVATTANLKAHCRIWTTNRGQVAFYRVFIQSHSGNLKAGSFYAYCADCKKGFSFTHTDRSGLQRNLFRTMRHAHTHVPDSQLSFYDDHFSISGSDSNSQTTDWLVTGIRNDLARFDIRFSCGLATTHEIELADEYRNVLEFLTRN